MSYIGIKYTLKLLDGTYTFKDVPELYTSEVNEYLNNYNIENSNFILELIEVVNKNLGATFAKKRDEIRWIDLDGISYGFDCTVIDITNFTAAYMPLAIDKSGSTMYKVWTLGTDGSKLKTIVTLTYDQMKIVYDSVRTSQYEAYEWLEKTRGELKNITNYQDLLEFMNKYEISIDNI